MPLSLNEAMKENMHTYPLKILITNFDRDFERSLLEYFSKEIEAGDYHFIFSHNLSEAAQILENNSNILLLISAINPEDREKFAVFEMIQTLGRPCKVILISNSADMQDIRLAMNKGAFDFFVKPISFADLKLSFDRVREYVQQQQETQLLEVELKDLEKQLDVARTIQQSFLPQEFKPFPNIKTFEIYGQMIPAKHVGGDFFDFFPLDDEQLGLLIADVSGKGIPSALFMAVCRTIIRTLALQKQNPLQTIEAANHFLNLDNQTSLFVTASYAIFNTSNGSIELCNAGHNPPLIMTKEGKFKNITLNQGLPLGILNSIELKARIPYQENNFTLAKGDIFILYTDGISEAINYQKEAFGVERIKEAIAPLANASLKEISECLNQSVEQFSNSTQTSDDRTTFLLRYIGR